MGCGVPSLYPPNGPAPSLGGDGGGAGPLKTPPTGFFDSPRGGEGSWLPREQGRVGPSESKRYEEDTNNPGPGFPAPGTQP